VLSGRAGRGYCAVLAAVVVCAALVVSGCGKTRKHNDPLATAASSAAPSVDPSTAAAKAEVLQAYNGWLEVSRKADAAPDVQFAISQFSRYLADPMLTIEVNNTNLQSQLGLVYEGVPVHTPRVTEVKLAESPGTATIEDCADFTKFLPVYKANHSPYPIPSDSRRNITVLTATRIEGKGWRITKSHRDRPC
jgi:hypothetical protein